eukprot:gene10231-33044_t
MVRLRWSRWALALAMASVNYAQAAQETGPDPDFVGPTCLMDMPRIYGTVCWFQNRTYCHCPAGLLCRDGADFFKEPEGEAVGTCMSGPTGPTTKAPEVESEADKLLREASSKMVAAAMHVNGVRTELAQLQHELSLATSAVARQGILAEIRGVVADLNDALDAEHAAEVALGVLTGSVVENNRTDTDLFTTTLPPVTADFAESGLFSEAWHYFVAGGSLLVFTAATVIICLLIRRKQRLDAYGKVLHTQNGQAHGGRKGDGFGTISSHFHPPSLAGTGDDYYFSGGESIMGSIRGSASRSKLRGRKVSAYEEGFGDFDATIGALYRSNFSGASVTSFYPDQAAGQQQDVWVEQAVIQESPFEQQQDRSTRSSHFNPLEEQADRRGSFWVPQAADLADDGLLDYGSARPLAMFDGQTAGANGGGHFHPPSDNQGHMENGYGYGQLHDAGSGHEQAAAEKWQASYNQMWQNVAGAKWEEDQEEVARAVNRQLKPKSKAPAAYGGEAVDEYLTLGDSSGNANLLRRRGSTILGAHDPLHSQTTYFDGADQSEMAGLQAAGLWDGPTLQEAVQNHEQDAWGSGGWGEGDGEQQGSFPTLHEAVMQHEAGASDWQSTFDPAQGKNYWYNSATGTVQWDRPAGV